jgi:RNA polymerase-binding transcription factor DksA
MTAVNPEQPLNLDDMERDLADVELALGRLENGTYWTDELTGAPIDSSHLAANPTARRNQA